MFNKKSRDKIVLPLRTIELIEKNPNFMRF